MMRWILVILLFLLNSRTGFAKTPTFRVLLDQFPEDQMGINIKVSWPRTPNAHYYKLKISRDTPFQWETETKTITNFYYLKLYPWKHYTWEVQAFDAKNIPISGPNFGNEIYLKSTLFPQSMDEIANTSSLDPAPQILPKFPQQKNIEKPKMFRWWLSGGLGATFFQFDESISTRAKLNSQSFTSNTYQFSLGVKSIKWHAQLNHSNSLGTLGTPVLQSGSPDFSWIQSEVQLGYWLNEFIFLGHRHRVGPVISYQMNAKQILLVDSLDRLHKKSIQFTGVGAGFDSKSRISKRLYLPLRFKVSTVTSSAGEGIIYNINSGTILSLSTGLEWRSGKSWTFGFLGQLLEFDALYSASLKNEDQSGHQKNVITNLILDTTYNF